MEVIEKNVLIANRVKDKGDTWELIINKNTYSSLTETLEAYFQVAQKPCEFRLAPMKGELYVIATEEQTVPPPKKYNIYGDR